jgi:hypothetical protein
MAWDLLNFFAPLNQQGTNAQTGAMGVQTPSTPWTGIDGAAQFVAPQRLRDVVGKLKVSQSQNIYDADFEYGTQPLRWEQIIQNVSGQAYIVQNPGLGGVQMNIGGGNTPGDITIRQSRPYHRYQPGKTMYMASNVNFGSSFSGQTQRVGIFDDSNGIFFMQTGPSGGALNPYAMNAVIRSDAGGLPVDQVIPMDQWNGNKALIYSIDWTKVQMIWMEYAWYGAGALRWGVTINGEPWVLHQVGVANAIVNGVKQIQPWSRTGNLPVRYEQRDNGSPAGSLMTHYGVSVLIEGGRDNQRGFTYSYGNDAKTPNRNPTTAVTRYPLMSFRMRTMGADIFDQTNAAATGGSPQTLTISAATPAISSVVGQANGGQALLTFASAHGYAVTNPANANAQAQYITLSSFTETATIVSGNYAFSGTTSPILTVTTAVATGALQIGQTLSGTGIVGTPTITSQLTATSSAVGSQAFSSGGAIGSSIVVLAAGTSFAVGQLFAGTGVPSATYITAINGATITINKAFTVQAAGTYTSYAPGGLGTYSISAAQSGVTGTLTATTTYPAQTWLIQSVPTTTTMVLPIQLSNGATLTSTPTATYWGANQFVGKSVFYQASLPAISGIANPTSLTIAGLTQYSSVITFASAHGLKQGDVITISGSTPATMNGIFAVNIPGANPTTTVSVTWGNVTPGNYTSGASATAPYTARITSNTTSALTFGDVVTGLPMTNSPASGNSYQIGLIDRGQLLPTTLLLNSNQTCLVELIASTPTNEVSLTGASFVALNTLGSYNSFAEQDLSATVMSGGEVVYAFSTPPNGLQQLDLSTFFPVVTNIRGNIPDILTVAVTCLNSSGVTIQTNIICQEAMA